VALIEELELEGGGRGVGGRSNISQKTPGGMDANRTQGSSRLPTKPPQSTYLERGKDQ